MQRPESKDGDPGSDGLNANDQGAMPDSVRSCRPIFGSRFHIGTFGRAFALPATTRRTTRGIQPGVVTIPHPPDNLRGKGAVSVPCKANFTYHLGRRSFPEQGIRRARPGPTSVSARFILNIPGSTRKLSLHKYAGPHAIFQYLGDVRPAVQKGCRCNHHGAVAPDWSAFSSAALRRM